MEQKQETRYFRDRDGWNGKTLFALSDNRELSLRTYRTGGKLVSLASVNKDNGDGTLTFIIDGPRTGDYMKRWIASAPKRVTEPVVRSQHESLLAQVDAIRADADAYYAAQERFAVYQ